MLSKTSRVKAIPNKCGTTVNGTTPDGAVGRTMRKLRAEQRPTGPSLMEMVPPQSEATISKRTPPGVIGMTVLSSRGATTGSHPVRDGELIGLRAGKGARVGMLRRRRPPAPRTPGVQGAATHGRTDAIHGREHAEMFVKIEETDGRTITEFPGRMVEQDAPRERPR